MVKLNVAEGAFTALQEGGLLIDNAARCWKLKTTEGFFFTSHELFQTEHILPEVTGRLRAENAKDALNNFVATTINPVFLGLAGDILKEQDKQMKTVAQGFRTEFVRKLGEGGAEIARNLMTTHWKEAKGLLADLIAEDAPEQIHFSRTGKYLLPPGGKVAWEMCIGKKCYTVFAIEIAPCVRNVAIFDGRRNLAFPWICMFPVFAEGKLKSISVFYLEQRITSFEDPLLLCNIPNVSSTFPYATCGMQNIPPIALSQKDWGDRLLRWYWDSEFVKHDWSDTRQANWDKLYRLAAKEIPLIANLNEWEKLSASNPEKITKLPWLPADMTIQECAQKLLETWFKDEIEEGRKNKPKDNSKATAKKLEELNARFTEAIEERLGFLAKHMSTELKSARTQMQPFLAERGADANAKLETAFSGITDIIVEQISGDYFARREEAENAATVPDLH